MNGNSAMPAIGFSEGCTYDMLDSLLNDSRARDALRPQHGGYGWAVRIWLKQGVIITALWGETGWNNEEEYDTTSLLAWSEKDQDYSTPITIPTDDIQKLEVL